MSKYKTSINTTAKPAPALKPKFPQLQKLLQNRWQNHGKREKAKQFTFTPGVETSG
jgi:hypothetical protein